MRGAGKPCSGFALRRLAEVTQHAITQAFIGDGAQLFLDRLDRVRRLAREVAGAPGTGW